MSVHTFRQRDALQRAQARWHARRTELHLVPPSAPRRATLGDRLCLLANRIHDDRRTWIGAIVILVAGELYLCARALGVLP